MNAIERVHAVGREETLSVCTAALLVAILVVPLSVVGAPGAPPASPDDATVELGAAVSVLDLGKLYGTQYCGYAGRIGHRWRDNVWFEGEYSHYVNRYDDHAHSVLLAGLRAGFRGRWFGAFIKLQPGMVRIVETPHPHPPPFTRFALSAGGVLEARVESDLYVRFDLSSLIIWFGDAGFHLASPPRPGISGHPRWSIGIGLRR